MKYVCVKCKYTWSVNVENHSLVKIFLLNLQEKWINKIFTKGNNNHHLSGGLCDQCITDYVRAKQIKNGFEDCFKRAVEVCGRDDCNYHDLCCRGLGKKEG